MKKGIVQLLVYVLLSTTCISCSGVYRTSIDVLRPAEFQLPIQDKVRVLVVNNAAPQPVDNGLKTNIFPDTILVELKLSPAYFRNALNENAYYFGKTLHDTGFFDKISYYTANSSLKDHWNWMSVDPIPIDTLAKLHSLRDVDLIISVDRLVFQYEQQVSIVKHLNYANVKIDAQIMTTCSFYNRMEEKAFNSVVLKDSIREIFSDIKTDSTYLYRKLVESVHQQMAQILFEKLVQHITPYWDTVDRMLYYTHSSRSKEAMAFAKSGEWDKAGQHWLFLYNQEKNAAKQARLALNIAVSHEMKDQLDTALSWVEKSLEHYQTISQQEEREVESSQGYLNALKKRIEDNKKLDTQFTGF